MPRLKKEPVHRIDLEDGKYTVVYDPNSGKINTLRYGEPWQEHVGDHLMLAMVYRILDLERKVRVERGIQDPFDVEGLKELEV